MARKGNKYPGVYIVRGKTGISYGIDYIHPQTGKRIKKILRNVDSETDAFALRSIEIADAARGAIDQAYGLKSKMKPVPFEYMVDLYLDWSRGNKKSWETDEYRARSLKNAFKGKLLSDINPFLIEKYKIGRAKIVKRSTVNKELILGSQVFEKAVEWKKYNGDNPFRKTDRFKIKKGKKPGSLAPEQVQGIMDEINHPVKKDMIEFGFNTGWRIGEIRKLKREDVDIEKGVAWIVDPKNSETVEIELNEKAIEIIKRQKCGGEYVFSHLNGKPFKTNLHGVIRNAAKRAGVILPPRKAWHILRRTWASMMLQSGCDIETLRELGNWKDFSMPMWYAEAANREQKKKALNKIPDLGKLKSNGRNKEEITEVVKLTS